MKQETRTEQIRRAVADALATTGCGCCRDYEEYHEAIDRLGKLLDMARFDDNSGVDFWRYRTPVEDREKEHE